MSILENNEQIHSLQRVKDRLLSTSNDQLPSVLKLLLPRLLQLLNDSSIRNKSIEVLSEVMKRLKTIVLLGPAIDKNSSDDSYTIIISELLKLIALDKMPFICNFALTFLDIILGTPATSNINNNISSEILVERVSQFEIFSSQSNSLCNYSLHFLKEVFISKQNIQRDSNAKDIIGDFLLDICLTSKGFQKGSLGSIQPGLSDKRVARICTMKKEWTNEDLRKVKLNIITNFSYSITICYETITEKQEKLSRKCFLSSKYSIAMSIILSCDPDVDVSTQAVFKMNGAMNLFHVNNTDVIEEKKVHTDVLIYLFGLCSMSVNNTNSRTTLKVEIRCAILRFICKELSKYLSVVSKNVIELVFSSVFNSDGSAASANQTPLLSSCMTLAELFLKNVNIESVVKSSSVLFIQCCKKILLSYSNSYVKATGSVDDLNLSVRTSCYNIIDIVARNNNYSVEDIDLVILLFQLLDIEDERVIPKLYTALGGLRIAHQINAENSNSSVKDISPLANLIISSRMSSDSKKRLASVQWSRALFGWQPITIDTLILLADDLNDIVQDAVKAEFSRVESLLTKDDSDNGDSILITLMKAFNSHSNILVIDNSNKSKIRPLYMLIKTIAIGIETKILSEATATKDAFLFRSDDSNEILKSKRTSLWNINELVTELIGNICKIRILLDASPNTNALFVFNDESVDDNLFFSSFSTVNNLLNDSKQIISYPIINIVRYVISILHGLLLSNKNNEVIIASVRDLLIPFLFGLLKYSERTSRINMAESFFILCYNGTPNFIMNLFRLFENKLIKTPSKNLREESITKSGALYNMGLIVEVIISHYLKIDLDDRHIDDKENFSLNEVKKTYDSVISILSSNISALSNRDLVNNPFTFEDRLNIVVSLEVYQNFALKGYLKIDERRLPFELNSKFSQFSYGSNLVAYFSLIQNFCKFSTISSRSVDMNIFINEVNSLLKSKESFIVSNAISLLSHIAILTDFRPNIWVSLFKTDLQDNDNVLVRFSLAEAIVKIATSDLLDRELNTSHGIFKGMSLQNQLLEVIKESLYSRPSSGLLNRINRKSLSVLLLVLVQRNNQMDFMQEDDIKLCLEALLILLKDNDGFIQDMCCLGICHIYNFASKKSLSESASTKKQLSDYIVNEVINALTREKRIQQPAGYSVAGESVASNSATQGENENNLRAPAGIAMNPNDPLALAAASAALELGISSENQPTNNQRDPLENDYGVYRIVCKVAKKTGDPAILFAVLSLIRRDPSFGIHLTESIYGRYKAPFNEIDPAKIDHLLPMLYLSKFDPTTVVRDVMRLLWDKLIPSDQQKKLLLQHHKAILNHLSFHLTSNSWKERESSCLALEAFLPQKDWNIIKPYAKDLWLKGMKVIDDVRISIRMASLNFMKVLSDSIIRSCNPDETALLTVNETIDFFVPLLIKEGLIAPSAEARGFCLGILLKVVQTAKSNLYMWLPELVSILVESMSALEPRTLQYMQFHTARLQISDEELENMRIKMSQTSPMQETLNYCLQSLNELTIPMVVSELCRHIKSGVGLSTRVAAVESISYLVERYPHDLGVHSITAFETIIKSLIQSPQMTISLKRAMMTGTGSLAKVVNIEALGLICDFLVKKYNSWDRNDTDQCKVIAGCIEQIVRKGGDRLIDDEVWIPLLTCIYIGCFDPDSEAMESWTKVWNESALSNSGTGTKYSALRKIFQNLILTINNYLVDLSWNRRIQGVNVIRDLLSNLDISIFSSNISSWIYILFHSIPGQIWSGQGVILETLSDIVSKCRDNIIYEINETNDIEPLMIISHTIKKTESSIILYAQTRNEKIAFKKDETFESIILNSSADLSNFDWKINIIEFAIFLVNECSRGNKDYRMSASKSLSLLPWAYISSKNHLIFFKLLPILCEKVGIFLLSDENSYSEIKEYGNNNRDRSTKTQAAKSDIIRKEKNNKLSNSSIFGIRYGSDLFNKKYRVTTTTVISEAEEEIPIYESSQLIISSATQQEDNVEIGSFNEVMDIVQESIESKPTDVDISNNNDQYLEIELIYSKIMDSTDPAYRMLFVDSINRGWPNNLNNTNSDFYSLLGYEKSKMLVELVNWALFIFYIEAWSVRKSAVMMIGLVGQAIDINNEVEVLLLDKIMRVIQKGLEEEKYVQIKVESLKSLDRLLNSKLKSILNDNYYEMIRTIIRKSSEDTKPSVLESVAKLQESWLR